MPASFKEYEAYDALGLAALVKRREVSAGELLDAALERVAARNPAINAVCEMHEEVARKAIAAGLPAGPFEGVPFLLKDITAAARDFPMSQGSRFFAGQASDVDSEVVARHRRSGLVIFGRTTTPEMAISPSTEARLYGGPTRNPWNLAHSTGGSSGGAAAAVAPTRADGACHRRRRIDPHPAACRGSGLKLTAAAPAGPLAGEGWGAHRRPRDQPIGARQRRGARRHARRRSRRAVPRTARARVLPRRNGASARPAADRGDAHHPRRDGDPSRSRCRGGGRRGAL
jgi:amidase/6-aminohexanoate-cyclic-dimer hydrolase